MENISFYKMSGSGNDFIIIDNRDQVIQVADMKRFVSLLCKRAMAVGADGMILVESSDRADFRWRFFNSDGSNAEMCGNGARCVARYAYLNGIAKAQLTFETEVGIIEAGIRGNDVRIKMSDPQDMVLNDAIMIGDYTLPFGRVNTGVPHVVMEVKDLDAANVTQIGREIRFHPQFAPAGTNVNFIAPLNKDDIWAIRTYERGVEDETLACGTGNVAAALVLNMRYQLASPVTLKTRSGSLLKVYFQRQADQLSEVYLEGDARVVYVGQLNPEAWQY